MRRENRELIIELLRPPIQALAFVIRMSYGLLFGWWLGPWLQRRGNESLANEVSAHLYFLKSQGQFVTERRPKRLPADSIVIRYKNVLLNFTRWHGELSVSVAPAHNANNWHRLVLVIPAIDGRRLAPSDAADDWEGIERLLRPRLERLSDAFSEANYAELSQKI